MIMGITKKSCNMDKSPLFKMASKFMGYSIITDDFTRHVTYFLAARWPYCGESQQ